MLITSMDSQRRSNDRIWLAFRNHPSFRKALSAHPIIQFLHRDAFKNLPTKQQRRSRVCTSVSKQSHIHLWTGLGFVMVAPATKIQRVENTLLSECSRDQSMPIPSSRLLHRRVAHSRIEPCTIITPGQRADWPWIVRRDHCQELQRKSLTLGIIAVIRMQNIFKVNIPSILRSKNSTNVGAETTQGTRYAKEPTAPWNQTYLSYPEPKPSRIYLCATNYLYNRQYYAI